MQISQILSLANAYSVHTERTHWTVSMKLCGKGNYLQRLQEGGDTGTKTAEAMIQRFAEIWPEDLDWPSDIPRPAKKARAS